MGLWAWYKRMICNKRKKENKPKKSEALIEGDALTKQALSALDRIHLWSKIQSEIRTRRLCMVTESRIKQKKLQNHLKLESKLHELEVEWCGGPGTMDEIVSKIHQREEASNKRERAMAYAFSHQWRANSNLSFGQAYYDLSKESWGWSWMERWIAICPWETRVVARPTVLNQRKKPKETKTLVAKVGTEKGLRVITFAQKKSKILSEI
ncbi:protein IQ-DOMAIN 1-like isoform X2 [Cynara cardunculus var. scolymus]|uniref:protein IQ-DOMAIN 1-like isoform X2 n=1 Tax=Cynara cardunculus var. scolymus TaxID=59895 RepID=UPI000D62CB45|nr:protein IQ-DOMAIN 1-like isoform X2 [Cynara cardunculus var. scolymus]